jgi:DNA-binding response OmpR family regulator
LLFNLAASDVAWSHNGYTLSMNESLNIMTNTPLPLDGALKPQFSADKPLVLIVEDYEPTRDLLRFLLAMKGCEVIEADLQDVIIAAEKFRPSLMLIDVGRPFKDSLETIKQVQKCESLSEVPKIITSGNGTSAFLDEVKAAGYDELLVKPIDFGKLDGLLEQHLFRKRSGTFTH